MAALLRSVLSAGLFVTLVLISIGVIVPRSFSVVVIGIRTKSCSGVIIRFKAGYFTSVEGI